MGFFMITRNDQFVRYNNRMMVTFFKGPFSLRDVYRSSHRRDEMCLESASKESGRSRVYG